MVRSDRRAVAEDFAEGPKTYARSSQRSRPSAAQEAIVDAATGEITRAQIFVAVLGASNYTFACATPRQTTADWIVAQVLALEFIGGVPSHGQSSNPNSPLFSDQLNLFASRSWPQLTFHSRKVIGERVGEPIYQVMR